MRKVIAAALLALLLTGCAKNIMIPTPPNTTEKVKAVLASDLPPEAKERMVKEVDLSAERQYQKQLDRADKSASNWLDILARGVSFVANIATTIFVAKK